MKRSVLLPSLAPPPGSDTASRRSGVCCGRWGGGLLVFTVGTFLYLAQKIWLPLYDSQGSVLRVLCRGFCVRPKMKEDVVHYHVSDGHTRARLMPVRWLRGPCSGNRVGEERLRGKLEVGSCGVCNTSGLTHTFGVIEDELLASTTHYNTTDLSQYFTCHTLSRLVYISLPSSTYPTAVYFKDGV